MKKCANCGLESPDDAISCPSCSTDSFVSASPDALGHIISPAEQRFWERMTFRQFAVFLIRLQAFWLFFYAVVEVSYLLEYVAPGFHLTPRGWFIVLRIALHITMIVICLRYADRIVSWFVKDIVAKPMTKSSDDKPVAKQIAAGNAGWPVQFRFAVHADWSRVPELWTLGGITLYENTTLHSFRTSAGRLHQHISDCIADRRPSQDSRYTFSQRESSRDISQPAVSRRTASQFCGRSLDLETARHG